MLVSIIKLKNYGDFNMGNYVKTDRQWRNIYFEPEDIEVWTKVDAYRIEGEMYLMHYSDSYLLSLVKWD